MALDLRDADGESGAATAKTLYLHGPLVDQVLVQEDIATGAMLWHLHDHQNTTRDLVDYDDAVADEASIVEHYTYEAFGRVTSGDVSKTRYLYTGQEFDEAIDSYYYNARWYDPATGRFHSEDPIGFAAGDANLYRYVENSPVIWMDPTGTRLTISANGESDTVSRDSPFFKEHSNDPTKTRVLEILIDSEHEYTFETDSLAFELELRSNIVKAARELDRLGVDFGEPACNGATLWDHPIYRDDDDNEIRDEWTLLFKDPQSKSPSAGIRQLLSKKDTLTLECFTAAALAFYKGLLDTVGDEKVDSLIREFTDYNRPFQLRPGSAPFNTDAPRVYPDHLPGDWVGFVNPGAPKGSPWENENAILLDDGTYYGHGVGIHDADEILRRLSRIRGVDQSKKPYLRDEVQRFIIKHLRK